jgi:4-hydroxy-tetrahydrodipicolinate synthase
MKKHELITAMITPFKESDAYAIDFDATKKIILHLASTGSDCILVAGTSGECPTLSHEEEIELLQFTKKVLKENNASTKVMFGAGSNNTATAVKMSALAQMNGADSILSVCPYYNKPNQEGLKEHFSQIAQACDLPIYLYNVPSRTNISINAETIFYLAENFANIKGLKEASTNFDLITEIRTKLSAQEFSIYSGDDSLTLPMLNIGANGVISVASHLVGTEIKEMMIYFNNYQIAEAQKIHNKLFPLFTALFTEPNPTCIKEALGIMNMCSNKLRAPLVNLSLEQKEDLKKVLQNTIKATI